MTTKTQRLINRIEQKESFYDIAYLCEDFDTFIDEISEWGVDHIGGVSEELTLMTPKLTEV